MIKFDLEYADEYRFYVARTMDGQEIGRCRFYKDGYICVIDMLQADEADVVEGLCRASFDKCLQDLCAYGVFQNIDTKILKSTCFDGISTDKSFLVTKFFHVCCNCEEKSNSSLVK